MHHSAHTGVKLFQGEEVEYIHNSQLDKNNRYQLELSYGP